MRIVASIHWYQQSPLHGTAAECVGLSRVDFLAALARRRVDVFAEENLVRELRGA
jgi:hypothetical protein